MNHPKLCKGHSPGGGHREGASSQALYRWLWGNFVTLAPGHKPACGDYIGCNKITPELNSRQIREEETKTEQPRTTQQNQFLPLLLDHRYHALNMLWFYLTWRYRQNFATSKIDLGPCTLFPFPSLLISGCSPWLLARVGLLFSLVW